MCAVLCEGPCVLCCVRDMCAVLCEGHVCCVV